MQRRDRSNHSASEHVPHATPSLPVVLAIHGSASSGRQWKPLTAHLEGVATVIAPVLPGYGCARDRPDDRLAVLGRMLGAQSGQVHLVAHSLGSAVALRLAHAHPDRAASVTLYDPITTLSDGHAEYGLPADPDKIWRRHANGPSVALMQGFFDFRAKGVALGGTFASAAQGG